MRIAGFSFRSIPLRAGCAGADKFALELYPRLVELGHEVVAYNRLFKGEEPLGDEYKGVKTLNFYTPTRMKGFDTLLHSFKCSWDIIVRNTADVVHIQNGGNSPFALVLRLFGKKVFISQDGADWNRAKWPWYGRIYLWSAQFLTAVAPHGVVFDNIFCKAEFEKRFRKPTDFIGFGSEVNENLIDESVLADLGLTPGEYFLFVGRFIPDKGLQYLVPAFERLKTDKKLVLVGGSPNPSDFEKKCLATKDSRIVFPGYVYGGRTHALMKNAYAYIQPSDIEGLSPVVLESMGLGTSIICSDIIENRYVVGDTAVLFAKSSEDDLLAKLQFALENPAVMKSNAARGRERARREFSWEAVARSYERIFQDWRGTRHANPSKSDDTLSSAAALDKSGNVTAQAPAPKQTSSKQPEQVTRQF